jgi:GxxExxY protein
MHPEAVPLFFKLLADGVVNAVRTFSAAFCVVCAFCVSLLFARFCRSQQSNDGCNLGDARHVMLMTKPPDRSEFSDDAFPLQALTGTIIASSFTVFRKFGYGFLEGVYRRALVAELRHRGVPIEEEVKYELFHHGQLVGCYRADLVVDLRVIVEAKAGAVMDPTAPVQLLNYLCAAQLGLGLVIHFGPKGAARETRDRDRAWGWSCPRFVGPAHSNVAGTHARTQ